MSFIRQAIYLVPTAHRRKGSVLILLLTLGSLLDLFSLASFIPLVVLAIDPAGTATNFYIDGVQSFTGLSDPVLIGVILTLMALLLTLLKTQVNIWITFYKASYAYDVATNLASQALTGFFQIPFKSYLGMDYTKEMNRISNLPVTYANNFIIPFGTIISESLILITLILVVAIYNFSLFIFLGLIISPVALLYYLKRKKIRETSQNIKQIYPKLLKYTLQAIEGLPEIRIFGKENFFKKRFSQTYTDLGKTFATDHTTHTSSARTTEVVMAICIGTLIIYTLLTGQSAAESILLLTLYAGASFRMMPSANRIFAASLQIRTHEYVVGELSEILTRETESFESNEQSFTFRDKIEIRNLSFGYEGRPLILKNVSLSVQKGEKIVLAGKSGSGKTTLLMLLMRFLNKHDGDIIIDGQKLMPQNTIAWRRLLGYVPQNPYILDASILENIAFGIEPERIQVGKVSGIIHDLDLENWVKNLPEGLHTIIGEKGVMISGGQRQRIAIARSLYHDAEILLLDEITNQLDRETELEVVKTLDNLTHLHKTIILIAHRPELWISSDSVYEIKDHQIQRIHPSRFYSVKL